MSKSRDLTGTGRYPPQPFFQPIQFYNSVRFGDSEVLAHILAVDPYYITQDNGAGAPVHFATTYRQLDMLHHLLNNGAPVNQQDTRGLTPLHRAAHLAHLDGYMEIYEYLLSRGADPTITADKYDEYLEPGPKYPWELSANNTVAAALQALDKLYETTPKAPRPNPYVGDWWTLYDHGLEAVLGWSVDYEPEFPEERKKKREAKTKEELKDAKKAQRAAFLRALEAAGPEAARAVLRNTPVAKEGSGTATSSKPRLAGTGPAAKVSPAAAVAPPKPVRAGPFTAFLFPGQGSQAVGMLQESCHLPEVKEYLEVANRVLGYDLLAKCLNGPKEDLDATQVAQPALLIAGLAAAVRCTMQDPESVARCGAAAGLSLGEYSALVWAGAMSVEDGLKVVRVRAEAMSAAAKIGPSHGMLSVVGLPDEDLKQLCSQVLSQVSVEGGTVCQITNYLFPQGRVVSGHLQALEQLSQLALAKGALKATMLAVSGAFHTRLMEPAKEALAEALSKVTLQAPRVPVISNVTAQPFPSDPDEMRALLARQLVEPVQWESSLRWMLQRGVEGEGGHAKLFELGPGQQIKAMVRRLDGNAWKAFTNVQA